MMNYGPEWRKHRRAFHQQMNSDAIAQYEPIQLPLTRKLLRRIFRAPKELKKHLSLYVVDPRLKSG